MNTLALFIQRFPLMAFFGLAFVLEWVITPLGTLSPALPPFIFTFLPALAALLIVGMTEGKSGVKTLLSKLVLWRVGLLWYVVALGLPVLVGLICIGLALLFGSTTAMQVGAFAAFRLVFFVFAAGEELGWRGYALPKLQPQFGTLGASLLLGVLWFSFHLPLFLPGQFYAGTPVLARLLTFVATSVIYTWLLNHTQGSVLMASLLHGSMNVFGILYVGMSALQGLWLPALVWSLTALVVIAVTRGSLGWTSSVREKMMRLEVEGAKL
jgi:uncharacterized protein